MKKTVETIDGSVIEWSNQLEVSFEIDEVQEQSEVYIRPLEGPKKAFLVFPYKFSRKGSKTVYTVNKRLLMDFLQYATEFITHAKRDHLTSVDIYTEVYRRFFKDKFYEENGIE